MLLLPNQQQNGRQGNWWRVRNHVRNEIIVRCSGLDPTRRDNKGATPSNFFLALQAIQQNHVICLKFRRKRQSVPSIPNVSFFWVKPLIVTIATWPPIQQIYYNIMTQILGRLSRLLNGKAKKKCAVLQKQVQLQDGGSSIALSSIKLTWRQVRLDGWTLSQDWQCRINRSGVGRGTLTTSIRFHVYNNQFKTPHQKLRTEDVGRLVRSIKCRWGCHLSLAYRILYPHIDWIWY